MTERRDRMAADLAWRERQLRAAHVLDRHEALVERLERAGGDAFAALWAVVRYLIETQVPRDRQALLMAVAGRLEDDAQRAAGRENGKGGRRYSFTRTLVLTEAAATVTALKERDQVPVPEAVNRVAKAAKIPASDLRRYRDYLSNKRPRFPRHNYDQALRALRAMPEEQFGRNALQIISDLSAICDNPLVKGTCGS